ncbi:CRISPR-associated protein Csx18 [Oscillatoria sp. FACHB-1406]|uniref:CRISPR-associated protein Csx18 n=1 Tax=Oscillatoria sp. FACHB-1406 TaxID=2692846 RepID=UPI0018EF6806|nr:CRISPR-associated protein Csx18 [Oscillatoria sp. FACHB-1406]
MYLSNRAAFVRSIVVSGINGAITLILLLIAPLGLALVITNTVLIVLSTFVACTLGDRVVAWLLRSQSINTLGGWTQQQGIQHFEEREGRDRR